MHTHGAVPSSATLTRTSAPIQTISFTFLYFYFISSHYFIMLFYHVILLYYFIILYHYIILYCIPEEGIIRNRQSVLELHSNHSVPDGRCTVCRIHISKRRQDRRERGEEGREEYLFQLPCCATNKSPV